MMFQTSSNLLNEESAFQLDIGVFHILVMTWLCEVDSFRLQQQLLVLMCDETHLIDISSSSMTLTAELNSLNPAEHVYCLDSKIIIIFF